MKTQTNLTLLLAGFWLVASVPVGAQTVDPDPLAPFFSALTESERHEAAAGILDSDLSFESILARLREGPRHADGVPRGRLEATMEEDDGHLHRYLLLVPESYDPGRRYPLRVYLHGGTYYPDRGPGGSWWPEVDLVTSEDHVSLLPLAWDECLWWQNGQIEALRHMVTSVKRAFNVDDDRVYLLGVSDGGAGVYFSAMHNPTPWAAYVPMIGNPQVLENPNYAVDGHTYAPNLRRRHLFIVNTSGDEIHPPTVVASYLRRYEEAGAQFEYREYAGGHDLSWWPQATGPINAFLERHRRNPHPDVVEWVTDRVDRYNRNHWVIVDELGRAGSGPEARLLASLADDDGAGVVHATHLGNTFTIETKGVRRIRLLLSPDEIDFDMPVRVTVNDRTVFDGPVARDPRVLLHWAAIDFDRTMLYGAELEIAVPR